MSKDRQIRRHIDKRFCQFFDILSQIGKFEHYRYFGKYWIFGTVLFVPYNLKYSSTSTSSTGKIYFFCFEFAWIFQLKNFKKKISPKFPNFKNTFWMPCHKNFI